MKTHIIDESNIKHWRTELPNIIVRGSKSDISVYAKWLYVYLKSVAGENGKCWQSTKTIAEGSGISAGKVSSCKKELVAADLIEIEKGNVKKGNSDTIKIRDIWASNILEFNREQPPSSDEHPPSRGERPRSPHEYTPSRDESKNNPIKKEPYKEVYGYGDSGKYNSDNHKIDHTSFVEAFNDLYDCQLRVTDKKRENIRARLETFTGAEIKKAWENRLTDDWLSTEGREYLDNWKAAMRNDEKVEKYLEQKSNNGHDEHAIYGAFAN